MTLANLLARPPSLPRCSWPLARGWNVSLIKVASLLATFRTLCGSVCIEIMHSKHNTASSKPLSSSQPRTMLKSSQRAWHSILGTHTSSSFWPSGRGGTLPEQIRANPSPPGSPPSLPQNRQPLSSELEPERQNLLPVGTSYCITHRTLLHIRYYYCRKQQHEHNTAKNQPDGHIERRSFISHVPGLLSERTRQMKKTASAA